MPIPSGRAYSAPNQAREIQALRDEVAQLRRRMTNPPKIPPPVVAGGGGGIVGQAEIYSMDGTVGSPAGETAMEYWNVQWRAPYDPSGLSDPSWARPDGNRIVLDPGSYIASLSVYLSWPSKEEAPDRFDVVLWGGEDIAHLTFAQFPPLRLGNQGEGAWGLNTVYNPGPFKATRPMQVEVQYGGPAGATQYGSLVLLITKFS